jgi:Nif-specific regulatory protein
MNQVRSNYVNEITKLSTILLATLDESLFFTELSKYISTIVPVDSVLIYRIVEKTSLQLVSENNEPVVAQELSDNRGVQTHVLKTKRPYFSNNTSSDPMFDSVEKNIQAELCLPITEEGVVIAIIRLQINKENDYQFSKEDITKILSLLRKLSRPLKNIRLFMEAHDLNISLLKKIEDTEAKLQMQQGNVSLVSEFQVEEREITGKSKEITDVINLADKVAGSELNILIKGDAGTGKKLLARRIHCRSHRSQGSFIIIDCSSKNEHDLDIELFGIERTPTNDYSVTGLLESANNGTIILNNVHSLSLLLQSKIIRFLEEGIGFKSCGHSTFKSNARIIATTSVNIENRITDNKFREDFYYAISKVTIPVPGLKDRVDDIEHLANYFLNHYKDQNSIKSFSPSAIRSLKEHSWPGNIRELQNIIERADVLSELPIIDQSQLPDELTGSTSDESSLEANKETENENMAMFKDITLQELEQMHICRTLDQMKGNKTKTAKQLGITVKTLYNKLHSYGMIKQQEA